MQVLLLLLLLDGVLLVLPLAREGVDCEPLQLLVEGLEEGEALLLLTGSWGPQA